MYFLIVIFCHVPCSERDLIQTNSRVLTDAQQSRESLSPIRMTSQQTLILTLASIALTVLAGGKQTPIRLQVVFYSLSLQGGRPRSPL